MTSTTAGLLADMIHKAMGNTQDDHVLESIRFTLKQIFQSPTQTAQLPPIIFGTMENDGVVIVIDLCVC